MTDVRISAIGAYAPRLRITADEFEDAWGQYKGAGIVEKAVPEADEDALTMAFAAAQRSLDAADLDGSDLAFLSLATTTPPVEEEDLTARLVSMLSASGCVTSQLTGSTRAGGQALNKALDAGPWNDEFGMVVISDCPRGAPESKIEHAAGAGAVALILDSRGSGTVVDRASAVQPFPGARLREAGTRQTTDIGVKEYTRRAFTSVINSAVDELDAETASIEAVAVQSPDNKRPYRETELEHVDAGKITNAETVSELGDTGAASAFLGVTSAVRDGHERILLLSYGSGAGANVFLLDVGDVPLSVDLDGEIELTYSEYLRRRGQITSGEPDGGGAYVSVPSWQRSIPQRHRLVATRCLACREISFSTEEVCTNCHADQDNVERVELSKSGTVEAVTTISQGGAPPEFVEQQSRSGPYVSAIVSFEVPETEQTVSVPMQVVTDGDEVVSIGAHIEATIRRIYEQEGVIRYGRKARLSDSRG